MQGLNRILAPHSIVKRIDSVLSESLSYRNRSFSSAQLVSLYHSSWSLFLACTLTVGARETGLGQDVKKVVQDQIHWSLEPVIRPVVPSVAIPKWKARNPIDNFIFAKLAEAKLSPSPEASRRALVRRLYFDLIGLPPTPAEARAFEKDKSTDAYPKLVERLLASPQYGERWARHWLDVVRFAETHGFEMN